MNKKFRSSCAIASLLDILGDKWSLLIIRDLLIKHKKTFGEVSNSPEKIAPGILSARFKLLEKFGLITKHKSYSNKKENIYLLTKKAIDLASILVECTIWSDKHIREYNTLNSYKGLDSNKHFAIQKIQSDYLEMLKGLRVSQNLMSSQL